MISEGCVRVTLSRIPGGAASVSFQQPGDIGRLLRGKRPGDALRIIPQLYSVCATAQAHASVTALEQALGIVAEPRTASARAALTAMETLREHVLRIALDWPVFYGAEPAPQDVAEVMKLGQALANALFGHTTPFAFGARVSPDGAVLEQVIRKAQTLLNAKIFGEPVEVWRNRQGLDELYKWAEVGKTPAMCLLASVLKRDIFTAGNSPSPPLLPPTANQIRDWLQHAVGGLIAGTGDTGLTPETTLFTRNLHDRLLESIGGNGLGARLLARLVELSHLPERIRALAMEHASPTPMSLEHGFGIATIDAARGLLIHAVELRDGNLEAYGILPPTRWNFDANGVAARSLSGLQVSDEAQRLLQAQLIINAIDPCVCSEIRLEHSGTGSRRSCSYCL